MDWQQTLHRYLNVYYSCFKALSNTLHLLYLMSIEVAIPSSLCSNRPNLLLGKSSSYKRPFSPPASKNRTLIAPSLKKKAPNFTGKIMMPRYRGLGGCLLSISLFIIFLSFPANAALKTYDFNVGSEICSTSIYLSCQLYCI